MAPKTKIILIVVASVLVLGLIIFFSWKMISSRKTQTAVPVNQNIETQQSINISTTTIPQGQAGIANPASVNCVNKGGKVEIQKKLDGSEYGLCYFEDNRACEEWALMRGDCSVGGVKTTGFDTDAQKYCAWVGGQTTATANAVCTFKDKSVCSVDELYSGNCQAGNYVIEKILTQTCAKDAECETPASYQVLSRCPFISKCLANKCTVVCPKFK